MNSRILINRFEYYAPTTVEKAVDLLSRHAIDGKPIAGGTDLLVQMKQETLHPRVLVSIRDIPELQEISFNSGLQIGSAVVFRDLIQICSEHEEWLGLFEALRSLATVSIRNLATIGGNLCNASPAADSAPSLLALGATVCLMGPDGERILPLCKFFEGPGRTLARPDEIMFKIVIPPLPEHSGCAFEKVAGVGAGIAKVNAAAFVTREGDTCTSCRIALGSVAPIPMRLEQAEALLQGKIWTRELLEEVVEVAATSIRPITDIRSTESYRKRVASNLVRSVLFRAWERTKDN